MDHTQVISLVTSVLTSGVFGLIAGILFYFLLPKAIAKIGKYVSPETMEKVDQGLNQLISIKSAMDLDPKNEDMVEKILRYSELAVHSAEQVYKANGDNSKKKEYATNLALKLIEKQSGKEAGDLEKEIVNGLIETVVGVQKKVLVSQKPQKSS